jgi:hypothetical protein
VTAPAPVRPAPRRVRGTRLEFRRVPWWLARYLAGPGGADGNLRAALAEIAARVRLARVAQAGAKGSAPRLSPGPVPGPGKPPSDRPACDI